MSSQSPDNKLKVLYLCTGNSCRSQMAEGWARHLRGNEIEPYSAGVNPHGLNPYAVKVMAEAGVDISNQTSDHVDKFLDAGIDLVISVCGGAREECPHFPVAVRREHVPFDDPPALTRDLDDEEEILECYRRVRDEIKEYVALKHRL